MVMIPFLHEMFSSLSLRLLYTFNSWFHEQKLIINHLFIFNVHDTSGSSGLPAAIINLLVNLVVNNKFCSWNQLLKVYNRRQFNEVNISWRNGIITNSLSTD